METAASLGCVEGRGGHPKHPRPPLPPLPPPPAHQNLVFKTVSFRCLRRPQTATLALPARSLHRDLNQPEPAPKRRLQPQHPRNFPRDFPELYAEAFAVLQPEDVDYVSRIMCWREPALRFTSPNRVIHPTRSFAVQTFIVTCTLAGWTIPYLWLSPHWRSVWPWVLLVS